VVDKQLSQQCKIFNLSLKLKFSRVSKSLMYTLLYSLVFNWNQEFLFSSTTS
jgi:hypothetical protein